MIGDFLFIHYGYGTDLAPHLVLLKEGQQNFEHIQPRGHTLTLAFDTSARYCTGWHDLATGQSYPCPDAATTQTAYNQCPHCRRKTGFNPAFYNASSVSQQQQARNAEPHFLYLAHFGPGVVKVGISWAKRGIRRLLDQGARSYIIIKEYPTATIARQYEAKVARLPGVVETVQVKTKHKLLTLPYDSQAGAQELLATRQRLADELNIHTDNSPPATLDHYYLGSHTFAPHTLAQADKPVISGHTLGIIGCHYLAEQDDTPYCLPLSQFTGYKVTISPNLRQNVHTPQQIGLF